MQGSHARLVIMQSFSVGQVQIVHVKIIFLVPLYGIGPNTGSVGLEGPTSSSMGLVGLSLYSWVLKELSSASAAFSSLPFDTNTFIHATHSDEMVGFTLIF